MASHLDGTHPCVAPPVRSRVSPPAGAPNVLLVLVDDMGFGASSAFGGPCQMPTAERLAQGGLTYTRFHTTAICAPTRVSLLTGRNHHGAGMGTVPEMATSWPGYDCIRPDSMATLPQTLSSNGYLTGAFGKMHQTPMWEVGETGPFDRWPLNEGFDRFYGFIGAETNHFTPALIDGFTPIAPPRTPEEGYHLSEDLVDQAAAWIENVSHLEPDRPWFNYLSFGACHDPFHVPESWRGRYRGRFEHGWHAQREQTLERQKAMGLVPQDATLPAFDPDVPDWNDLTDDQRTVSERLMELYAEFAEHMDVQVGRLLDRIEQLGQLDNTLVIYVVGDNGAATEAGLYGSANMVGNLNAIPSTTQDIMDQLDDLGGPDTYPHYPVGWALAMNTPYQQSKKYASHYGGTRNGMIVQWPERITDAGGIRHQWHHCVDVTPTILEAAGIPAPTSVDGVEQAPMDGTAFNYTFDDAEASDRHLTQYFEIHGSRGIHHDGWTASTLHNQMPWARPRREPTPFDEDVWELYHTDADWTQARDVADQYPEKLEELKQLFLVEAEKNQVLPLDDRLRERLVPSAAPRPDLLAGRRSIVLKPSMQGLREGVAPDVKNTSFALTADVSVGEDAANGVLIAQGGRFAGWSVYLIDGVPVYCYNLCGTHTYVRGSEPLSPGDHRIEVRFDYDGAGPGKGGEADLMVDGTSVGTGRIERTIAFQFSIDETMDIGRDRGTPVTPEYSALPAQNAFTATLHEVRIDLGTSRDTPSDEERRRVALAAH